MFGNLKAMGKRIGCILLVFSMILSLSACSGKEIYINIETGNNYTLDGKDHYTKRWLDYNNQSRVQEGKFEIAKEEQNIYLTPIGETEYIKQRYFQDSIYDTASNMRFLTRIQDISNAFYFFEKEYDYEKGDEKYKRIFHAGTIYDAEYSGFASNGEFDLDLFNNKKREALSDKKIKEELMENAILGWYDDTLLQEKGCMFIPVVYKDGNTDVIGLWTDEIAFCTVYVLEGSQLYSDIIKSIETLKSEKLD